MRKILILILLFSLSFAKVVPVEQDVANHAFLGAAITKVVNEFSKNEEETFWIMTALFIGKEIADLDNTGFSINDLVYDYVGFGLIMWEFEF